MKSIYFLVLAASCLFLSCKKDKEEDGSYHISCKVDGVAKTFNTLAFAVKGKEDLYGLVITGRSASGNDAEAVGIVLTSAEADIGPNTYTDAGTAHHLIGSYQIGIDGVAYGGGTEVNLQAVSGNKTIVNHFKVVISSVTENAVRGTFSGDVYKDDDIDAEKKTLLDGSFYVPIIEY